MPRPPPFPLPNRPIFNALPPLTKNLGLFSRPPPFLPPAHPMTRSDQRYLLGIVGFCTSFWSQGSSVGRFDCRRGDKEGFWVVCMSAFLRAASGSCVGVLGRLHRIGGWEKGCLKGIIRNTAIGNGWYGCNSRAEGWVKEFRVGKGWPSATGQGWARLVWKVVIN